MNSDILKSRDASINMQWVQLIILCAGHFCVDMFAGVMPAILPEVRRSFVLSLSEGVLILTILNLTCNGMQVATGHLRAAKSSLLFVPAGLAVCGIFCLLGFLAPSTVSLRILIPLVIIGASGIAVYHPEGLRAVCFLDKRPPAISTAFFMVSGFAGFACGGWIGGSIAGWLGLKGLALLLIAPAVLLAAVLFARMRLAVDDGRAADNDNEPAQVVSFGWIIFMVIPLVSASTLLIALLPTRLNELGFSLSFGGLSSMVFGIGSVAGSLFWAFTANKKGELKCCAVALFLALPFFVIYLLTLQSRMALLPLFAAGFFSQAVYSLMVTMGRHAKGLSIGTRMSVLVGGVWGTASVLLMLLGHVAEKYGVMTVLGIVPVCCLVSGIVAVTLLRKVSLASVAEKV